jgi:hypothetical protein
VSDVGARDPGRDTGDEDDPDGDPDAGVLLEEPALPVAESPDPRGAVAAGIAAGGIAWFLAAAGRTGAAAAAGLGLVVFAVTFIAVRARTLRAP